ncbi:MAG: outer membrane protein transport protein [Sphingomonadales bacterium]|nr:outer membrane protein transport protein [Sphingomonadales bacterium]
MGWAASARAQAFYIQEQSVRGQGRAFSGEAADTGVDSMWWNPAAIGGTQGVDAALNASAILPRGEVVDTGSTIARPFQPAAPVGGNGVIHNPIRNGIVPSGAIAVGRGRIAVGLAITAPYNFTTNYDDNSFTRYTAGHTSLRTIDIQPSIAFMPTANVSIGAGVNVEHVSASLGNFLPNFSAALPDGQETLEGKGWDVGWSAGVQYRTPVVELGLAYKSSIRHNINGMVTVSGLLFPLGSGNMATATSASFRTPWQAIGSMRLHVGPGVTLDAQITRQGWSNFDQITLGAPLGTAIPENYRDITTWAIGADYELTRRLVWRVGLQHGDTPTQNGLRDARVPDANRWNISTGTSYSVSHRLTLDGAFSFVSFNDAPISRPEAAYAGTLLQTGIYPNGYIKDAYALVASVGGRIHF